MKQASNESDRYVEASATSPQTSRAGRFVLRNRGRIFAVATALILLVTLYPFNFQAVDLSEGLRSRFLTAQTGDLVEPLANFLLFVPFGISLAALLVRAGVRGVPYALVVLLAGTALSFGVEVLQVFLPTRTPSRWDIIMNGVGALAGSLLFRSMLPFTEVRRVTFAREVVGTYVVLMVILSIYCAPTRWHWSLSGWEDYPILLGNELSGDRGWSGEIHHFLLDDYAYSASEAQRLLSSQFSDLPSEPALKGTIGRNREVHLTGRMEEPQLDWMITGPDKKSEHRPTINRREWLRSTEPVQAIIDRISDAQAFTAAVHVKPSNVRMRGPARIMSLSGGTDERNLTIGQDRRDLVVRVRTPFTGKNGANTEFVVQGVLEEDDAQPLAVTFRKSRLVAYVGNDARPHSIRLDAENTTLWWLKRLSVRPRIELEANPSHLNLAYCGLMFLPAGFLFGLFGSVATPRACRFRSGLLRASIFVIGLHVVFLVGGSPLPHFVTVATAFIATIAGVALATGYAGVSRVVEQSV